jgi:hypothetical protein
MAKNQLSYSEKLALRERIKELTCLYGIAQIAGRPGMSLDEVLQGVVELLPPAWQYPEIASARITRDGTVYQTVGFREAGQKQTADIVVGGRPDSTNYRASRGGRRQTKVTQSTSPC